jgi:hypothetical protein
VVGDLPSVLLHLAGRYVRGLEVGELGDPGGLLVPVLLGVDIVAQARGFRWLTARTPDTLPSALMATIRSMRPL